MGEGHLLLAAAHVLKSPTRSVGEMKNIPRSNGDFPAALIDCCAVDAPTPSSHLNCENYEMTLGGKKVPVEGRPHKLSDGPIGYGLAAAVLLDWELHDEEEGVESRSILAAAVDRHERDVQDNYTLERKN